MWSSRMKPLNPTSSSAQRRDNIDVAFTQAHDLAPGGRQGDTMCIVMHRIQRALDQVVSCSAITNATQPLAPSSVSAARIALATRHGTERG